MKVEGGQRFWLVPWEGEDEDGNPWDDQWEPTKNVSEDLREQYLNDQKQKVVRAITVDPRPLDGIVQQALALSVQHGAKESFGLTQATPIAALSLRDLAEYYLSSVSEKYGVELMEEYDPSTRETTREVRLLTSRAGDFCAFEKYIKASRALKSLVFRGLRVTNVDMVIVAVIMLRYVTNKRTEGLVSFEAEYHTCYINGNDGNLEPPHLSAEVNHWLNHTANKNAVVAYAREIIPDEHPLVGKGWKDLAPHVWRVPNA